MQHKIVPNLWFDTQSEEAAAFYTSIFPNSRIVSVARYPDNAPREAGMVMTVAFELDGQRIVAINGGPDFTFSEAFSLQVECETQAQIDHFWAALTAGGGEEGPCGWLKDRFGLSWQITPTGMDEVFEDPDTERSDRAFQAMLGMKKLDIAALKAAADGVAA